MSESERRPKRRQYVVDGHIQWGLTAWMLVIVLLAAIVILLDLVVLCELSARCEPAQFLVIASDLLGAVGAAPVAAIYAAAVLALSGGGLVVLCLLIAHRVAGPAYKIADYLAQLEVGKHTPLTL